MLVLVCSDQPLLIMISLSILCILIGSLGTADGYLCPVLCSCKHVGPQNERLRVRCNKDIDDIKDIHINAVGIDLYYLDLSKNRIYVIEQGIFQNLTNLKRLDLSMNKVTTLNDGCFTGLDSLERLDLSKNQIASIDSSVFRHLSNLKKLDLSGNKISAVKANLFHDLLALERLKLNGNLLKTLSEENFHGLKFLHQLDLSNNPWKCDCHLYWISNWKNTSLFRLNSTPTCDSPPSTRGQPILDIHSLEDGQCQFDSPVLQMHPDHNQVVFAGDSMSLECSIPSITDDRSAHLNWSWNPNIFMSSDYFIDPQGTLSNVKVENNYLSDAGVIRSSITIFPVRKEHNGQWNCQLISIYGTQSKRITMIVISEDTNYCPLVITKNNKGVYAWPRTVVGWKVELPCEGTGVSTLTQLPVQASYQCNSTGSWNDLNTESCPFISPTTKALEQYSKVNLSLTKGNLLETVMRFRNHTGYPTKITDPIEIHFIAKTIENYLNFLIEEKDLGAMLVGIISSIMAFPRQMLKVSETSYNACTRLIKCIEVIAEFTPSIQLHTNNMALEEFRVKTENFVGLTCTWYSTVLEEKEDRLMHCATNNKTVILNTEDRSIEASIQLPASLFHRLDLTVAHQLMISMYSSNNFLPLISAPPKMDITSGVIGCKLIGRQVVNLTEPVYIMLKMPRSYHLGIRPRPVVWDLKSNVSGEWSTDGCQLSNLINNLIVFHCNRLGYYGLLEDTSYFDNSPHISSAKFRYSNPAIYVGTFVAIICLTITSVTYIICYASIIMPKRAKHCVVNTWISIILLCFLYTTGIQQTDSIKICQAVGLLLHYLSLCSLLWMTASASNMYKRLSKLNVADVPDDELSEQPIQKPLLGIYLVGWGIALIVCGISGAINLKDYAGYSFCFLSSSPALTGLFVPAIILVFYLTIFYLLVRCAIRNADHNRQLSEGTQATENMDLELLEPNHNRVDQSSVHSTQTVSSDVEDIEYSQITQLKGHIVILILYLIVWCSGAAATVKPFSLQMPHEETLFAVIYATSSSALGIFVLLFYGIARNDVRTQWNLMRCWWHKKKNRCCRSRSVTDTTPALPAQPLVHNLPVAISNIPVTQVISDTNSLNSLRFSSVSRACDIQKTADIGVNSGSNKGQNMNLVVLHRQQYRSNNSVTTYTEATHSASIEMFYNPRQSGVARKFFKKQRRHTKTNNLGPRKRGDGGATSDGGSCISVPRPAARLHESEIEKSIFGSSAKVNNTNLHVELNLINITNNINILSDSGGSISEDRTVPIRYIIGQENRQDLKKMNNDYKHVARNDSQEIPLPESSLTPNESDVDTRTEEEKRLRNVSQQCSLEYSSDLDLTIQMMSERSDHNLSEFGEMPEPQDKIVEGDFNCSSFGQACQNRRQKPLARSQSSSLYFLSEGTFDGINLRNSSASSLNDVRSADASSRNCQSRISIDDLQSEERLNERINNRSDHPHSTISESNFISENVLFPAISPMGSGSLRDVNPILENDTGFPLRESLTVTNSTATKDLTHQQSDPTGRNYLTKDFNSLHNLPVIDVILGTTRHLDINASIGADYEDSHYEHSQHFSEDGVPLDDMLLESNSDKKETCV
ncbi:probable G-protein coupled receptor 125 [Fopius arisanus]|uniref:Gpr125_1 protein n=2 Tax=Fopius arisanus TaxID=64838 RepID=A0A0C9RPD9_9HYME|nr:PREDICTED: probable G-protein coupled receptor 125 [Fopius arisanus]